MHVKTVSTHVILLLALAMLLGGCGDTTEDQAKEKGVEMYFEAFVHDYGEIPEGSDGEWSFGFKNLGEKAIVINRVRSTCGCTIPKWTKEPIKPGETGKVSVKYNTTLTGTFMKSVYVYSSAANSPVKLQIKGKVIPSLENN